VINKEEVMRKFGFVIGIAVFLVLVSSCENSVRKANDSKSVVDNNVELDEDSFVNDENNINTDKDMVDGEQDDTSVNDDAQSDTSVIDVDNEVPDNNGQNCAESDQCGSGNYCHKDLGMCFAEGICEPKPQECPEIYFPVCGCDDNTYDNDCMANVGRTNAFYSLPCLKDADFIDVFLDFDKGITGEEIEGEVIIAFKNSNGHLSILTPPESTDNGDLADVLVVYKGANGIQINFSFKLQRDPFSLPQNFNLERDGFNKATVLTDTGLVVGYLTGNLEVTRYEKDFMGTIVKFSMGAEFLQFVK